VLKVDREIEHEDGDNDRRPGRQTKPWNEADAMPSQRERKATAAVETGLEPDLVEEAHAQVARQRIQRLTDRVRRGEKASSRSKERQHARKTVKRMASSSRVWSVSFLAAYLGLLGSQHRLDHAFPGWNASIPVIEAGLEDALSP